MVGRKKGSSLTPLELQDDAGAVEEGPGNVQHVQKNLPSGTDLAYNTVQTMLNILHRKGRVRRTLKGRAYTSIALRSRRKRHWGRRCEIWWNECSAGRLKNW